MQKELCTMLNTKLGTLSFLSKQAGLVQAVEVALESGYGAAPDGGNLPSKMAVYPVAFDVVGADCTTSGTNDYLIPNAELKGLSYFEDLGMTPPTLNRNSFDYEARVRFVCWMNSAKISKDDTELTAKAMAHIISTLVVNPFNSGIFSRVQVNVRNIPVRDKGIFAKYTYDEKLAQYLIPPFEYFAIDFGVKFNIPNSCLSSIANNPAICP